MFKLLLVFYYPICVPWKHLICLNHISSCYFFKPNLIISEHSDLNPYITYFVHCKPTQSIELINSNLTLYRSNLMLAVLQDLSKLCFWKIFPCVISTTQSWRGYLTRISAIRPASILDVICTFYTSSIRTLCIPHVILLALAKRFTRI